MVEFFFHWIDIGVTRDDWIALSAWNPAYAVRDEEVLSAIVNHKEGQIPTLTAVIRNPQVGLLTPHREVWVWFSWTRPDGLLEPLFFGHLLGIPSDILGEAVEVQFIAKSKYFKIDKQIAAEALKVEPFYDPLFLSELKRDDPDAILEGYSALWHIDRKTLAISPSDILLGEDGIITFLPADVPYDSVKMNLNQVPLTMVDVKASVNWAQQYTGYITDFLKDANGNAINFESYTGDGIIGDWPKPFSSLGSGWTVVSSFANDLRKIAKTMTVSFSNTSTSTAQTHNDGDVISQSLSVSTPVFYTEFHGVGPPEAITKQIVQNGFQDKYAKDFQGDPSPINIPSHTEVAATYVPAWLLNLTIGYRYDSNVERSERMEFLLTSAVQPVLDAPDLEQDTEVIEVPVADVGAPIIDLKNWTSVAGKHVAVGQFIFPNDPDVPGQTAIQVCVVAGVAGLDEPLFSNVSGVTTNDGTVVWSSLGSSDPVSTITDDWQAFELVPLGDAILPRAPIFVKYADLVLSGRKQNPVQGVPVSLDQIIQNAAGNYYQCVLDGTTGTHDPSWNFTQTTDGTVKWQYIGNSLPTGHDYFICTTEGTTGAYLPQFATAAATVTDGTVQWTHMATAEVPIGGFPGNIGADVYFPSDRGLRSIRYLLCVARAHLRLRARVVEISFDCRYEMATQLSCRMNAEIFDHRLPGGTAAGKIIEYTLKIDGSTGIVIATVRMGCAVGEGGGVIHNDGTPTYVEIDYVEDYQYYADGTTVIDTGGNADIGFTPPVTSKLDNGPSFPLSAEAAFPKGGLIIGVGSSSLGDQANQIRHAIDIARQQSNQLPPTDLVQAIEQYLASQQAAVNSIPNLLQQHPRWVETELAPISGNRFDNAFHIITTDLVIPKMIDLEVASPAPPPPVGGVVYFATARFIGVGSLRVAPSVPAHNTGAAFAGSGVMRATATHATVMAGARFAGAGSMAAKALAQGPIRLVGTGRMGAIAGIVSTGVVVRPFEATGTMGASAQRVTVYAGGKQLIGTGTMIAKARLLDQTSEGFAASGTLVAKATQRQLAAADFVATGTFAAGFSASLRLVGTGNMTAKATLFAGPSSTLIGVGTLAVKETMADAGSAEFDAASALGANAKIDNPFKLVADFFASGVMAAGISNAADLLLAAESDGIAAVFTDAALPSGSLRIKDTVTPANNSSGTPFAKLAFSRSSAGTYFNSAGVLSSAPIDTPRIEYDPATLAKAGLLMEEARTNIVPKSEDFSDVSFIKTNATIVTNAAVAPDGNTTADQLIDNSTNSYHLAGASISVANGATVTASVFAKKNDLNYLVVFIGDNVAKNYAVLFDLNAGTVLGNKTDTDAFAAPNGPSTIQNCGNGWYRCSVTTTLDAGRVLANPNVATNASGSPSTGWHYVGTGKSVFVWGMQLEEAAYPTSYIPTTAGAVARSGDFCSLATSAFNVGTTAKTLFAEYDTRGSNQQSIFAYLNTTGGSNRVGIEKADSAVSAASSLIMGTLNDGTATNIQASSTGNSSTAHKTAIAYDGGGSSASDNGAAAVTAGSRNPLPTSLRIGGRDDGLQANGHVKTIMMLPRRMSDAEIQALTS